MTRDIRVISLFNAEEYVAFEHICEEDGESQSSVMRRLVKAEIRRRALSMSREKDCESAEPVHVLHTRNGGAHE